MGEYSVYLLDMTQAGSTNGVDRHLSCLLSGLSGVLPPERLFHIRFVLGGRAVLRRTERLAGYTQITIPLPERFGTVAHEVYWSRKYNEAVCELIEPCLRGALHPIVHLHTLNLIDLALEIRRRLPVRIVAHLHCLPWKYFYNTHPDLFNRLYARYYLMGEAGEGFYTNAAEKRAYTQSDRVVACTACGRDFVRRMAGVDGERTTLVSNATTDRASGAVRPELDRHRRARLLFVGSVVEGKGIFFILEALRRVVAEGYGVELFVAGAGPEENFERIRSDFSTVPVHRLGVIGFDELRGYYETCDIGVIGSVQEQNSYVAIEMAMFGLPVVTTAADGLDEMFTDRVDALKVPVVFDRLRGLRVDVARMRDSLVELLTCPELRRELGAGARRLYERKYTLPRMTDEVVRLYESIDVPTV